MGQPRFTAEVRVDDWLVEPQGNNLSSEDYRLESPASLGESPAWESQIETVRGML